MNSPYTVNTTLGASMGASPAPTAAGGMVKDVTTDTFMADVIDASMNGPVVVDFWAPWCGPCKQLGPVIEKVVNEAGGKVTLAKMDIEKYPEVAGQMGIQSIPAVVAFVDGRPAEAFMGNKPESEVRAFIDQVAAKAPPGAGKPAGAFDPAPLMEAASAFLANGDHAGAAEAFGTVAQNEPGNLDALAGLGECYMAVGETDMARQIVESVPEDQRAKPPLAALAKRIELSDKAAELGDIAPLKAAVDKDPADHQARFDYAIALAARDERREAVDQLVLIVRADREWQEDGARTKMLELFETWGHMDKATIAGRRALSSILFS